ncbi:MAG: hypothetical protein HY718_11300 [Planctomycetes bacterium]|nr:hypothetical protein [Planctomycetota bacterium]
MCHHCLGHEPNGVSRREFFAAAAGAGVVGGFLLRAATAAESAAVTGSDEPAGEWPEVRVAYLRQKAKFWLGWPGTSWENRAYPEFMTKSRGLIEKFGHQTKVRVNFEPEPLYDDAGAEEFIKKIQADKPAGVILVPVHMHEWGRVTKIAKAGIPTIVYAPLGVCFTGHVRPICREKGVHVISTADFEMTPVRFGLKMVRTHHEIRRTRIARLAGNETKDEVLEPFGVQLRRLPRAVFADAFKTIRDDDADVLAMVEDYQQAADKVVEPARQDLINAAKNYFASLRILKEHDCQGITMDCLGAVFDKQIPCPPCMAWSKFLDVGVPAICEADINAVMSHTLCCKLLDKPGFMQDPVPETVNNTLIGAHCVCPTRLNGYEKPRETFMLRSHSESDVGVSVQVIWKPGQEVTVMQMTGPGKMILGKGKVLRNFETPPAGGCRTSVELAMDGPADIRDTKGFHQLFIYGDHVSDFEAYAQMYGIETEHV